MSADLVVIVPSRGRPANLARLIRAVHQTTSGRAIVLGLVDQDDPYRGAYLSLAGPAQIVAGSRRSLVDWTNFGAQLALAEHQPTWLASMGDDHLPITPDWDQALTGAIRAMNGPGWAYGNDMLQGENLPTAWVTHRATVDALGWLMLPSLGHMYPDNVVGDLGRRTQRIAYLPGVLIEHLHPLAGKASSDASYESTNAPAQFARDSLAYRSWQAHQRAACVAAVQALTWAVAPC